MDAKSIGNTIAQLRKQHNLTQMDLAARLHISDKTVSRWESGSGYPEITQFPILASIFGVSIDYLITGQQKGILIAGNILTDIVKNVDCYPKKGMLANIHEIQKAVGGCVPNTAIDLAKIDRALPISVAGKIGDDEYGRFVLSELSHYGIDCEQVRVCPGIPTSFSDVISLPTGERTFFHARGANAQFSPEDISISSLHCVMAHIGYLLLLDRFDAADPEYGTVMARFLCQLQQRGIKTSIDVVSDSSANYRETILPALRYCDYAILNEVESSMLSGLSPYREDESLDLDNIRDTMELMAQAGVKEKVIVHCKTAGFCLDVPTAQMTTLPSLEIPSSEIKGSVGAGDAFCAGCLYGLYHHYDDMQMLEFASAAAASSLFAENSTDGMRSKFELQQMMQQYGRKIL